jgi:hypothetical protein
MKPPEKTGGSMSDTHSLPIMLPATIRDSIGPESEKTTWSWCGAFPLDQIAAGRKACRYGWRNRGDGQPLDDNGDNGFAMLAVVSAKIGEELMLWLESEFATVCEGSDPFHCIEDMQAMDWYLADEEN